MVGRASETHDEVSNGSLAAPVCPFTHEKAITRASELVRSRASVRVCNR
jgi:hypothetical protein